MSAEDHSQDYRLIASGNQTKEQADTAKAAADTEYFRQVQDQFRQEQARAKAEGRVVTEQTIVTDERGRGTVTTNYADARDYQNTSIYASNLPNRYSQTPDVVDLTPKPQGPPPTPANSPVDNTAYLNRVVGGVPVVKYSNPANGAEDFGIGAPLRGKPGGFQETDAFGNVQKGRYDLVDERKNYSVNLYEGRRPGKQPVTEEYYQPDPTNPFKVQSRGQFIDENYRVADARNPYDIKPSAVIIKKESPSAVEKSTGNIGLDFFRGTGNVLGNIGKTAVNPALKLSKQKELDYGPEIEGSVWTTGINAGGRAIAGQSAGDNLSQVGKEFMALGESAGSNLPYAAGSLAGSAIVWVGTAGIVPAAKFGLNFIKSAPEVLKAGTSAERVTLQASKEFGLGKNIDVQAFKIAKSGDEIPLVQRGDVFLDTSRGIKNPIGERMINIPGSYASIRIPGRVAIPKPTRPDVLFMTKGLEDLGAFSFKTGKGATVNQGISESEKALLVGQKVIPNRSIQEIGLGLDITAPTTEVLKGARAPATATVDVFKNEAAVLPKVQPPGIGKSAPDLGGQLVKSSEGVKIAESKPLEFTLAEFSTKRMTAFSKYSERSALTETEKGLFGPQNTKYKPFQFEKPDIRLTKTSKGPLENQLAFDFDRTLIRTSLKDVVTATGKGAENGYSSKTALGLYGGSNLFTSREWLGHGGATGAERKTRSRQDAEESVEIESFTTPKNAFNLRNSLGSVTKQGSRGVLDLSLKNLLNQSSKGSIGVTSRLDQSSKSLLNLDSGSKVSNDLLSNLLSTPKSSESLRTDQLIKQTTNQGFKFETRTRTTSSDPFNMRNLPFIPSQGRKTETKKKKGKKFKVKNRKFTVASPLAAVLGPFGGVGREVQKFSDAFDSI